MEVNLTIPLRDSVAEYGLLAEQYNIEEGLSSDCAITPEPVLACVESVCERVSEQ